jgi:hypothetical protein
VTERSSLQSLASWAGTAFLVLGIVGFVPGVTDHYEALKFAGRRSGAEVFGVFDTSILLNLVYVVLGIAATLLARRRAWARAYLLGGGALLLALWVFGLAVGRGDKANFIPVDSADAWLHFGLGLVMVALGWLLGRGRAEHRPAVATP